MAAGAATQLWHASGGLIQPLAPFLPHTLPSPQRIPVESDLADSFVCRRTGTLNCSAECISPASAFVFTPSCVREKDTKLEQSNERMHNHTLVRAFQAAEEISLHAYLVFLLQAIFLHRSSWLIPHQFHNSSLPSTPPTATCHGRSYIIHSFTFNAI